MNHITDQFQTPRSYACRKHFNNVYQFKIGLKDTRPPVWRRIQVPEIYTFWDLHVAIQDAMGWQDSHLHEWLIEEPDTDQLVRLGIYPAEFEDEPEVIMDWKVPIKQFFKSKDDSIDYHYDFGDDWQHIVFLEGIFPREPGAAYPRCLAGQMACPPEDIGGDDGYKHFVDVMKDREHPEHLDMIHGYGSIFDPETFSPENVRFWNPEKRLKLCFGSDA